MRTNNNTEGGSCISRGRNPLFPAVVVHTHNTPFSVCSTVFHSAAMRCAWCALAFLLTVAAATPHTESLQVRGWRERVPLSRPPPDIGAVRTSFRCTVGIVLGPFVCVCVMCTSTLCRIPVPHSLFNAPPFPTLSFAVLPWLTPSWLVLLQTFRTLPSSSRLLRADTPVVVTACRSTVLLPTVSDDILRFACPATPSGGVFCEAGAYDGDGDGDGGTITSQGSNSCPFFESSAALDVACNATAPSEDAPVASADALECQAASCSVFPFTDWTECAGDCSGGEQHRYRALQVQLEGGFAPHCLAEIETRQCVPPDLTCQPGADRSRTAPLVFLAAICGALCVIPIGVVARRKMAGSAKVRSGREPATFRRAVYAVQPRIPTGRIPVATAASAPVGRSPTFSDLPSAMAAVMEESPQQTRNNRARSTAPPVRRSPVHHPDGNNTSRDVVMALPTSIPGLHMPRVRTHPRMHGAPSDRLPAPALSTDRSTGAASVASSVSFALSAWSGRSDTPVTIITPGMRSQAQHRQQAPRRLPRSARPQLLRPNFHHPK